MFLKIPMRATLGTREYENAQRDANKARGTMDYKSSIVTETGACRCFRKKIF